MGDKKTSLYYEVDENFFKELSPTSAWVLGFIAADGSVITSNDARGYNRYLLNITQKNPLVLYMIKNHMISSHPIHPINCSGTWTHQLQIANKKIVLDLIELGIVQRKSLILRYPPALHTDLDRHFIRGYWDGDGSFFWRRVRGKTKPMAQCGSGSKSFIKTIRDKLTEYGLNKNKIYSRPKTEYHCIHYTSKIGIVKLFEYLYKDVSPDIYCPLKYNSLKVMMDHCKDSRAVKLNKKISANFLWREYHKKRKTIIQIATEQGIATSYISNRLKRYNIPSHRGRRSKHFISNDALVFEHFTLGHSIATIAENQGVHYTTIRYRIEKIKRGYKNVHEEN